MSSYMRMDKTSPNSKSLHTFDVEDNNESRGLISNSVEKDQKARAQQWRKCSLTAAAAVFAAAVGLGIVLGLVFGLRKGGAQTYSLDLCPETARASNYDEIFFVIGDWGRGNTAQREAANLMAALGDCYQPSFIISTGDNFYSHGLKRANDPFFTQAFTDMYSQPSLNKTWYAVLGNHDYGELSSEQLASCSAPTLAECPEGCCYSPLWQTSMIKQLDTRWNLNQGAWKKTFLDGQLDILFIDTTPMITKYQGKKWAHTPGGISSQDVAAQKRDIEALLSSSKAAWKLLVGHHPVYSYGEHCTGEGNEGDCEEMQFLIPLLKKYKVSAYFCGHEHDLQLIKAKDDNVDPVYYIVSGAGSDIRSGEFQIAKDNIPNSQDVYLEDTQGFVSVGVNKGGDSIKLDFWIKGNLAAPSKSVTIKKPT